MYVAERDRERERQKVARATRESIAVRVGNWIQGETGTPPICAIHSETAKWHKNRARESGGQWACPTCVRDKSKGQRRHWRTDHLDPLDYNLRRSFGMAKYQSKKIGRAFSIDFAFVRHLWDQQGGRCAVTLEQLSYIPGDGERRRNKVTMDRIDSAKGYTPDNVWLVCEWVNRAKNDLTRDELTQFAHGILSRYPQRSSS